MGRILLIAMTILFLNACASTDISSNSKAGLLCIEKTDGTGEVVHCLNPLSADAKDVQERVTLHNAVNKIEDHIDCRYKQKLGSKFTRWRCYYANRPDVELEENASFLDLIDKGNRL